MKKRRGGAPGGEHSRGSSGEEEQGNGGKPVDPEGWAGVMETAKVPMGLGPPSPRQGACLIRMMEGPGRLCLIPSECWKVKLAQSSP